MPAVNIVKQEFVELKDGKAFGIHVVRLHSSSDTLNVPDLAARSTYANAVAQVRDEDERSVTLSATKNTVTIAGGQVGDQVVLVTRHYGLRNFVDTDATFGN